MRIKESFEQFVPIITAIISSMAVVIAVYVQIQGARGSSDLKMESLSEAVKLRTLEEQSVALQSQFLELRTALQSLPRSGEPAIAAEIGQLEQRIDRLEQSTHALSEALNPLEPERVLTVARLHDAVNGLSDKTTAGLEDVRSDQEEFQAAVIRELDKADKTTSLILFTLIPLTLNIIYSMWKDFRDRRDASVNHGKVVPNPGSQPDATASAVPRG